MVSIYERAKSVVRDFASKYNLNLKKARISPAWHLFKEWQAGNTRKRKSIYVKVLKHGVFVAAYTNVREVTHWDWRHNYVEHFRKVVAIEELPKELEKAYRFVFS